MELTVYRGYKHFFNQTGMLSKSKGQILRVAAVMHTLFQLKPLHDDEAITYIIDNEISLEALEAAIDFIQTSVQHAAYIAGRSTMAKEVEIAEAGAYISLYHYNIV